MGVSDIYMGGVKWVPDFENQVSRALSDCRGCAGLLTLAMPIPPCQRTTDEWYPVSGGAGQIHVHVQYKSDSDSVSAACRRDREVYAHTALLCHAGSTLTLDGGL